MMVKLYVPYFLMPGHICVYACWLFYVVTNSAEVIACYYTYLLNIMDADSVSHMLYCNHLITDDDFEAIIAAPSDSKMNSVILEYAREMDLFTLLNFTDLLIKMETQQSVGEALKKGSYVCTYCVHMHAHTLHIRTYRFLYQCEYLIYVLLFHLLVSHLALKSLNSSFAQSWSITHTSFLVNLNVCLKYLKY